MTTTTPAPVDYQPKHRGNRHPDDRLPFPFPWVLNYTPDGDGKHRGENGDNK